MDFGKLIQDFLAGPTVVVAIVIVVVVLGLGLLVFKLNYRIVKANEVLVITGGKKGPRVIRSGGAFVSMFRRSETFSLSNMTIQSDDVQSQTSTKVPVVVKWTAQIRPDTSDAAALENAIIGYIGSDPKAIENSLKQTLAGEVRQVVATLTPDQVITDQKGFNDQVTNNVEPKMRKLGFELVSLNFAEVGDNNGHYENLAADDREAKRQSAEMTTANANQQIAVAQAKADEISASANLDKDLAVAQKARDVDLQRAGFDKQTAEARGAVTVAEAEQQQAAAAAQQQVTVTEAETARKKVEIEAQSASKKAEIDATAAATVAKTNATATAEAAAIAARGEAEAIQIRTNAEAEQVRQKGQAEADAAEAKGKATAAAILAEGQARAETERLMAAALAESDGVNKEIRLAEIVSTMQVSIATAQAQAVANIGEKVTIVDMGAGSREGGGSVLTNLLQDLPIALQRGDIKSQLLGGAPLGALVGELIRGVTGDLPGGDGPLGLRTQADKPTDDQPEEPATTKQPETPDAKTPATAPAAAPATTVSKPTPDLRKVGAATLDAAAAAPVVESEPSAPEEPIVEQPLDRATIEAALAQATEDGVSIQDVAEKLGVDIPALQSLLGRKFTAAEAISAGINASKKIAGRKK